MLTVYKQSWSEDISLFSVFHWEIGKNERSKENTEKKCVRTHWNNHPGYVIDTKLKRNTGMRRGK